MIEKHQKDVFINKKIYNSRTKLCSTFTDACSFMYLLYCGMLVKVDHVTKKKLSSVDACCQVSLHFTLQQRKPLKMQPSVSRTPTLA